MTSTFLGIPIEYGVNYPLHLNPPTESLVSLQYKFKPAEIDETLDGGRSFYGIQQKLSLVY